MIKTKHNVIKEEFNLSLKDLEKLVDKDDAIFGEIVYLTKEELRIFLPKHEVTETLSIEWISDNITEKLKVGEKYFIVESFQEPESYEMAIYCKNGKLVCHYSLLDFVKN